MENPNKRKFPGRDSYPGQLECLSHKLLVDNTTNTECQKPMMLNAWTQTEPDDCKLVTDKSLVDELLERIRKLEDLHKLQAVNYIDSHANSINQQSNQNMQQSLNCINGKTTQNLSNRKSPPKVKQPEKATYKIVAGPAGMEIIEPIEVEYAEEDGTYLDHDLNASGDSNRLEICLPKEEYSPSQDQQEISKQEQQQNLQEYTYNEPAINSHPTLNSQHSAALQNSHINHHQNQTSHENLHSVYTNAQNYNSSQHHQQDNKNLQYISVLQQNQLCQQQAVNTITSASTQSKINNRCQNVTKADIREFLHQENLTNITIPEPSNEVTVSNHSSSYIDVNHFSHMHKENEHREKANNIDLQRSPSNPEVTIGPNKTRVPLSVIESIDWRSVTTATRKLLVTIFDRETLATHTMTGKPSPAFKGRDLPSKHQLNPIAVQDIIYTVSRKCNVSEKEVRTAITTKCADENKMLKQREKKRRSILQTLNNKENLKKDLQTFLANS